MTEHALEDKIMDEINKHESALRQIDPSYAALTGNQELPTKIKRKRSKPRRRRSRTKKSRGKKRSRKRSRSRSRSRTRKRR